ncbi:MAG TPA: YihY/virulence factor BrkB family protein [Actinomycetota bacterium]
MNPVERAIRAVDGFQQRHTVLAFPFAVVKKFGDDEAGHLAALLAYYGFFSLFPLLLVMVTVLGFVLQGNSDLQDSVLHSALAQFPVIGDQIRSNVHSLSGSGLSLAVGIAGTLWGGLGVMNAMQAAMNRVWDVRKRDRPNFWKSKIRALMMLALLGVAAVASAVVAGIVSAGGHSPFTVAGGVVLSLALNLGVFLLAFRILTARNLTWGDVLPGAAVAAVAWVVLQTAGGYIVGHQLKSASQVYGLFALVIGLLAWMYLGAQVTLYAAEVNVVRKERLWPRSLVQPPLSRGDKDTYRRAAIAEERRPEESVSVRFDDEVDGEAHEADGRQRERIQDVEKPG